MKPLDRYSWGLRNTLGGRFRVRFGSMFVERVWHMLKDRSKPMMRKGDA